ncbi:MAG: hypothetical protein QF773_00905 [Lentisphaeria bacterium]|jgi:cytochrome c|nr:hypothetical protein [Lentisphaeria bacterium]
MSRVPEDSSCRSPDLRNHNFKWLVVTFTCISVLVFGVVDLGRTAISHSGDPNHSVTVKLPVPPTAHLSRAERAMKRSDCFSCHGTDKSIVGPSYRDIATRYRDTPGIVAVLMGKVRDGGSGNWGAQPMTPHRYLQEDDLRTMVTWILEQGPVDEDGGDQQ